MPVNTPIQQRNGISSHVHESITPSSKTKETSMGVVGLHSDSNTEKRFLEKLESGGSKFYSGIYIPRPVWRHQSKNESCPMSCSTVVNSQHQGGYRGSKNRWFVVNCGITPSYHLFSLVALKLRNPVSRMALASLKTSKGSTKAETTFGSTTSGF